MKREAVVCGGEERDISPNAREEQETVGVCWRGMLPLQFMGDEFG